MPTLQGATVVDFAYHVHTDVGNQMVAAKVNGKVVSPSHVLSNVEVVQIVSYKRRVTNGDIIRHKVLQPCHALLQIPMTTFCKQPKHLPSNIISSGLALLLPVWLTGGSSSAQSGIDFHCGDTVKTGLSC